MIKEANVSGSASFDKSEAPPLLKVADEQAFPRKKGILILSRDRDTCLLLKTILEMWHYDGYVCSELQNPISVIGSHRPNLILLDSVLPFASHLENIRRIRRGKAFGQTRIIVLSGFSQPNFKNLSFDAGADEFLVKPLDFDLLQKYLRRHLGEGCGKAA